ncbi:hypothetical protein ACFL0X_00560 [Nanoarchaeota archaeon]
MKKDVKYIHNGSYGKPELQITFSDSRNGTRSEAHKLICDFAEGPDNVYRGDSFWLTGGRLIYSQSPISAFTKAQFEADLKQNGQGSILSIRYRSTSKPNTQLETFANSLH